MMTRKSRLSTGIGRAVAAFVLLLGSAGCGRATDGGGEVTIMVTWSGAEFAAFYQLIEQFEASHHVQVNIEVTRAQTTQLDAAVQAGDPPDVAALPSIGLVDKYARAGELRPLTGIKPADFLPPFRGLMSVDGQVYAVPVKADVKSLIWYDPKFGSAPPTDPTELTALAADRTDFWCLGLASGPTSGWPGADWIADLYLARNGVGPYRDWLTANAAVWQTASVEAAWSSWATLVRGSMRSAATTAFADAAGGMATGRCRLAHGALAAMGFAGTLVPGTDYDFAAPAKPTALEVSGDFLGLFTGGNPAAVALIDYLSSAQAQTAWVREAGSYAFSANVGVTPEKYPGPVEQRIAALLRPDSGHPLCFGAADMMQPDMSKAFYQAVIDYAAAPSPSTMTGLLAGLDTSQKMIHGAQIASPMCSTPS